MKVVISLLLLGLAGLTATGCNRPSAALPDYDSQQAREALIAALDAWKTGKLQQLAEQDPPLRLSDDDLIMGAQLQSYQLSVDAEFAPHHDVQVDLVLRDRQGQTIHKQATYQIVLEPTQVVMRNDP